MVDRWCVNIWINLLWYTTYYASVKLGIGAFVDLRIGVGWRKGDLMKELRWIGTSMVKGGTQDIAFTNNDLDGDDWEIPFPSNR